MHATILEVAPARSVRVAASVLWAGVALQCSGAVAAPVAAKTCPGTAAPVLERFIDADCSACWSDAGTPMPRAGQWLLDWIVPNAHGDDAPLAPAAPPEAADRARRAMGAAPPPERTTVWHSTARDGPALRLRVRAGPAWNGYIAVEVDGAGRVPKGATAWVALVEHVEAGTDGASVPRQVVRALAGPYEPAEWHRGKPWNRLQAMGWPETAQPVRLRARAWIEQPGGRIVAMAGERCD
ncbi:MAG: hypothetical protein HS128_14955 [Ideonella sp.]|nr:hypothetical protein [Ideonella sp.]MCC7456109.1 hypothetical protein [Nitrospira sp.]